MTKSQIKKLIVDSDYKNEFHRPVIRWSFEYQNSIGEWQPRITNETIWFNERFQMWNGFGITLEDLVDHLFDSSNRDDYRNFELIVGGAIG